VFNLANNVDEEETLKKIEELKKEAKESSKNRSRVNFIIFSNKNVIKNLNVGKIKVNDGLI
jgi:hypothetical protein